MSLVNKYWVFVKDILTFSLVYFLEGAELWWNSNSTWCNSKRNKNFKIYSVLISGKGTDFMESKIELFYLDSIETRVNEG